MRMVTNREERTRTFNLVLQRHLLCRLSYFPNSALYCSKTRAKLKRETDASKRQSPTFIGSVYLGGYFLNAELGTG